MDTRTTTERTEHSETDRPNAPSVVAVILALAVATYLSGSLFVQRSPETVSEHKEIVSVIVGALAAYLNNRWGAGR